MHKITPYLLGIVMWLGATVTTQAEEAPALWSAWQTTRLTLNDCLRNAENAIRSTGFTEKFNVLKFSIVGAQDEYSASVRCIPSRDMVLYIVAGRDSEQAEDYLQDLQTNFR